MKSLDILEILLLPKLPFFEIHVFEITLPYQNDKRAAGQQKNKLKGQNLDIPVFQTLALQLLLARLQGNERIIFWNILKHLFSTLHEVYLHP